MTRSARPRRPKRRRLLLAAGVLVASLASVKFLDLNAKTENGPPPTSSTPSISIPLALPNGPAPTSGDAGPAPRAQAVLPEVLNSAAEPEGPRAADAPQPTRADPAGPTPTAVPEEDIPAAPLAKYAEPSLLEPSLATPEAENDPRLPKEIGAVQDELSAADDLAMEQPRWVEHTVAKGDSLARIFAAQGLEPALLHRIVNSDENARSLARIRPGQTLRFRFDELGELSRLEHHRSRIEHLTVALTDDEVTTEVISKAVDKESASAAGIIESSLFVDGQKAGLSDAKIMELAEIFGWDIDFALELRAGDTFRVIYEEHLLDGEKLRDGPILAAEFTNRGKTFIAVRYESEEGEVGYFDETGHSKRRAFLRTPIKFARISSRFNPKRWHPVLKRWRSHKGVDYAAPTGTPIKASGDGKVVFRGTKGGYGRTVILQHAGKYTTLYAHMSSYSKRARTGNRVKQGQVIGYVGKSGLASGPHLHYEFRVNGQHKDPLRVKLPKSLALPKNEIAAFKKTTAPLLAQLEAVTPETLVASVDDSKTTN